MHLLYLFQHYSTPDCAYGTRHYGFLEHLSTHHTVTLLTTDTWANQRQTHQFPWFPDGVNGTMFPTSYTNTLGTPRRALAFFTFAHRARRYAHHVQDVDLVYGISTPLTVPWAALHIARKKRIPFILEVDDLWPDFPIQMGAVRSKWMQRWLYRLEHRLYREADHIITAAPDMTTHVMAKGMDPTKVTTMPQGTDFQYVKDRETVDALRKKHRLENRMTVLYAGTFGRANAIPTLLQAAKQLAHRSSDIQFLFMGQGYHEDTIKQAQAEHPHIRLLPPQPRHNVLAWFQLADVSIVSFNDLPVLATNAPAKFCDSLAVGTPVIVTNPGWTKRFVETHRCGWYVPAEQPDALVQKITWLADHPESLQQFGAHGKTIAQTKCDRQTWYPKWRELLEKTVTEHTQARK